MGPSVSHDEHTTEPEGGPSARAWIGGKGKRAHFSSLPKRSCQHMHVCVCMFKQRNDAVKKYNLACFIKAHKLCIVL